MLIAVVGGPGPGRGARGRGGEGLEGPSRGNKTPMSDDPGPDKSGGVGTGKCHHWKPTMAPYRHKRRPMGGVIILVTPPPK